MTDAEFAPAVRRLLGLADDFYRSGRAGLKYLSPRCRLAVRVAGLVYAEIGTQVARRGFRVTGPRAFVPTWRKLALVARAAAELRPNPRGQFTHPPRRDLAPDRIPGPDPGPGDGVNLASPHE